MKKSLIGLLSLSALVITGLAACTPATSSQQPSSSEEVSSSEVSSEVSSETSSESSSEASSSEEEATLLTVAAALSLEQEPPYGFEYLGEKIRIENVVLTTIIGDKTAFVQEATGNTVADLANLELEVVDWGTCDSTRTTVTVEGVLADVNGHAVLEQAVIVECTKTGEEGTYYWPDITRGHLDNNFNRQWHGYWVSADVQLVTAPTTVVAGTEQTFQVVFPGEDTNLENPDNIFPIDVTIPAGITEKEATYINEWLAGVYYVQNAKGEWEAVQGEPVAVGSFYNMFVMHAYNNYVSSFIFNGSSASNTVPASIDNVFNAWSNETEETDSPLDILEECIVDADTLSELGSELAYSYVVDDSSWGTSVYGPNVFQGDQYPFVVTYYTYEVDALIEELLADFEAADFEINDSQAESDLVVFGQNGYTGITFVVWLGTDGYVDVYFYGIATFVSATNTGDGLDFINDYVDTFGVHYNPEDGSNSAHTTAISTFEDNIGTAKVKILAVQAQFGGVKYNEEDGSLEVLSLGLIILFEAETQNDAIGAVSNYLTNAFGNWEYADLGTEDQPVDAFYNEATSELVIPQFVPVQEGIYGLVLAISVFGVLHPFSLPVVE